MRTRSRARRVQALAWQVSARQGQAPLDLLVDSFACYRLTRLVVEDEITQPLVEHVGRAIHAGYGTEAGDWYARLTTCPWCSSVWIGAGVVALRALCPRLWGPVARLLAFSAVAGIIARED